MPSPTGASGPASGGEIKFLDFELWTWVLVLFLVLKVNDLRPKT